MDASIPIDALAVPVVGVQHRAVGGVVSDLCRGRVDGLDLCARAVYEAEELDPELAVRVAALDLSLIANSVLLVPRVDEQSDRPRCRRGLSIQRVDLGYFAAHDSMTSQPWRLA